MSDVAGMETKNESAEMEAEKKATTVEDPQNTAPSSQPADAPVIGDANEEEKRDEIEILDSLDPVSPFLDNSKLKEMDEPNYMSDGSTGASGDEAAAVLKRLQAQQQALQIHKEELLTESSELTQEEKKVLEQNMKPKIAPDTSPHEEKKFEEPVVHPTPQPAPKSDIPEAFTRQGEQSPLDTSDTDAFEGTSENWNLNSSADARNAASTTAVPTEDQYRTMYLGGSPLSPHPRGVHHHHLASSPAATRQLASFLQFQEYVLHHRPVAAAAATAGGKKRVLPVAALMTAPPPPMTPEALSRALVSPPAAYRVQPGGTTAEGEGEGGLKASPVRAADEYLVDQQLSNEEILLKLREAQEQHHKSYVQRQLLCQEYVRFVRQRRKERMQQQQQQAGSGEGQDKTTSPPPTTKKPATSPSPARRKVPKVAAKKKRPPELDSASPSERPKTVGEQLAQRSHGAQKALGDAEQDVRYWANRVKMLKAQARKAFAKIQVAKRAAVVHEVSVDMNERTRQALQRKQELIAEELQKRQEKMKQQNEIHQKLCSKGVAQMFAEKKDVREKLRMEEANNNRIIGHQRFEEVQQKIQRTKLIQQQKMLSLIKRVNDRAVKEEANFRRFEERVKQVEAKELQKQQEIEKLIQEGAQVLDELRMLKSKQVAVEATIENPILRSRFACSL